MSFPVTESEILNGIAAAAEKHRVTIRTYNLWSIVRSFQHLRDVENMKFPEALRETLNEYKLFGPRRELYKTAIGKIFSDRAARSRETRATKRPVPNQSIPTVLEGNQFAFAFSLLT